MSWKKILTDNDLPDLANCQKITLAQANTVTLRPGFYNIQEETLISGYGDFWYVIQLGSYSGGGYVAQLAIPYESGVNRGMFIRTAVASTWGSWEKFWTSGNDGNGSGLDADLIKGINPATAFVSGTQTSATNAWTGVLTGVTPYDGLTIRYYLPYAGDGSVVTLALNGGTAYPVFRYGRSTQITTHFSAGSVITMTFRTSYSVAGTVYTNAWIVDAYYDSDSDYICNAICSTDAVTSAKKASSSYYSANVGHLLITMRYANTAQSLLTMNVNGAGAKPIYINGDITSVNNFSLPAGTHLVYYDGTNYYFRTDGRITGSITGHSEAATIGYTLNGLTESVSNHNSIPISNGDTNRYLKAIASEYSKGDKYQAVSPFKQVYITRLNGDNYDNSSTNYIEVVSQDGEVLGLEYIPPTVLEIDKNLEYDWGVISLDDFNSTGTSGDYTVMSRVSKFNFGKGIIALDDPGLNFLGKKIALICYNAMGSQLYNGNPIFTIAKCNAWFGLSLAEPTNWVTIGGAFVKGSNIVVLLYLQNGTYWQPHYVEFNGTTLDFDNPVAYGKCLTGTVSDHVMIAGRQLETSTHIYFPCGGSANATAPSYGNGRCRVLAYTKSTNSYSINFDFTVAANNLIADVPATGWFYVYPNYIGFDGKYYYITVLYRNSTLPSLETEAIPDNAEKWILYEMRSTSPTSGFTDARPIVASYDVWGCEHNYPEVSYTFKLRNEIYIAVSGTNFVTKSGTRANREYCIYKRKGYGDYERDRRSPLIMNPMYANSMGITSINPTYQFDHMGSSLGFVQINGRALLFYTANHGTNLYKGFAVEKPELVEINI